MHQKRKRRLIIAIVVVSCAGTATALVLYSLKQNINLYYTPTQLMALRSTPQHLFRLGGMVEKGSVHYAKKGLHVRFVLTDFKHKTPVTYAGVLPALFREGQGLIVQGRLMPNGTVNASQVLAKHDERYHPPGIKESSHVT